MSNSQNQLGTLFGTVGLGLAVLVGGFYMLNNADEDYSDDDVPKRKTSRTKRGEEYYDDELEDELSDEESEDEDEDDIDDGLEVEDDEVDIDSDELPPVDMDDKPKKRGRPKK